MKKLYIDWDDYQKDIKTLSSIIRTLHEPHLVALYRGSLGMGSHLSNTLNLPLSIIDYQTRDSLTGDLKLDKTKKPTLIKNAGVVSNQTLVLIDDIYDTGITMNQTREYLWTLYPETKVRGFCLYNNNKISKPNWVRNLHDSEGQWVVFPWETV